VVGVEVLLRTPEMVEQVVQAGAAQGAALLPQLRAGQERLILVVVEEVVEAQQQLAAQVVPALLFFVSPTQ